MTREMRIGVVTGSAEAAALLAAWPGAVAVPVGDLSADRLRALGVAALVDAAHPFDRRAHRAARDAARAAGLPRLILCRAGYRQRRGDRWLRLRSVAAAAPLIPAGARVFATTGGEDLGALRRIRARLFIRRRKDNPGRCPLPQGQYVGGRGPFTVAQEMRLMRRLGIGWLITRDAGGAGSAPKLAAARRLGVRVVLIDRPPLPPGPRVTSVEEAVQWLTKAGS